MRIVLMIAACLGLATPAVAQVRSFALDTAKAYDGDAGFEAPGLFSVKVPPGNYRVTVTLGQPKQATDTTVKAEARRLMLDAVKVPAGKRIERSFIVNVRTAAITPPEVNAPGATMVELKPREKGSFTWDNRLTLEFAGPRPGVTAVRIEPVQVPTLFLLGDSTVTDQQFEPAASWGQMLTVFLHPDIAVANHAESGESMKSFVMAKRLAKVLESVKPGDTAMIQFGHNDQKANWPQTYAAAGTTYRSWLRVFIDEFRRRGVGVILVTSPERRNWTADGRIRSTLSDYAAAVKAVGADEAVPVIDLNAASTRIYEALGRTRAPLAFNDGGKDATHHNNYGAWVLARAVAQGFTDAKLPIAAHLQPGLAPFDPARPPAPETFVLASSARTSGVRPDGN
ncbi:rhamnogalacturonan acetylesterase [Sphingomonas sp. Leaf33]|uniref:rhamnogalacturonan acetylesterase n=1 Tax=Sphingomonas sp. Leaf33 TaxID=1736215 RepID=UPI0007018BE3|nr:rhamnogalacturonan acetylesterase [Sphingomonas sp. Leaf33]KQN20621.1 rhamnogalacturonan acetylesterase [Sphingomonas sp. Leaf33]